LTSPFFGTVEAMVDIVIIEYHATIRARWGHRRWGSDRGEQRYGEQSRQGRLHH
jgi:hypothetical protein